MASAAPVVKVYYGKPMLPDVSRVLACLYEKDVKFELVDIYGGQQMNHDLIKFQASRTPVSGFEDGSTRLFESRAICRYIVDKYADQGNRYLLGRDLLERASIEQWLKSEEHSFDPPSWALVFHLAFSVEPDRALITESGRRLSKVLDVYEQRLGESKFLAGDEFSLADLSHLPNSHYLARSRDWGHLFESRKNVSKWWEEISSRHSWQEVVKILNEVGLLNEAEVTSRGYKFLTQKKLDLNTPPLVAASEALSGKTQEPMIQPKNQEDLLDQQAPATDQSSNQLAATDSLSSQAHTTRIQQTTANGQSSTQPARTGTPPSRNQEKATQPMHQEDTVVQSVTPQVQFDAQSSTQLPTTGSTSSEKLVQTNKPPHQGNTTNQLNAEENINPAATKGALPRQTKSGQQDSRVDSSRQSTAEKIAADTKSSDSPSQKQEKISQPIGPQDYRDKLSKPQARSDAQSTTQPSMPGSLRSQEQENKRTLMRQAAGDRLIDGGATASEGEEQTKQQIGLDAKQGKTDAQNSIQQDASGAQFSTQGKNSESISEENSGKSSPRGQATVDAETLAESPAPAASSIKNEEENSQKTSQVNSTIKVADKQSPTGGQRSKQQGAFDAMSHQEKKQEAEPTAQTDNASQLNSPQSTTDSKSSARQPPMGAQPTPAAPSIKKEEENSQKKSQVNSTIKMTDKQSPTGGQPSKQQEAFDAMSRQEKEQEAEPTAQAKSASQPISPQSTPDSKLSTQQPPMGTQPTPAAPSIKSEEENSQETSQVNSTIKMTEKQSPMSGQTSKQQGNFDAMSQQEKKQQAEPTAQKDNASQPNPPQFTTDSRSSAQQPLMGARPTPAAPSIKNEEENSQKMPQVNSPITMKDKQSPTGGQPAKQQGDFDAMSNQEKRQQAEPTAQTDNASQPISPHSTTDFKPSAQQPPMGIQPSQTQEKNVQQTYGETTSKQVQTDVQSSAPRGSSDSTSMQKPEREAQLTGQDDTKVQPVSEKSTLDAQSSPKTSTSDDQSTQKKEQDTKQTFQERSPTQAGAKQGPTDAEPSTQQGITSSTSSKNQDEKAQEKAATHKTDSPNELVDQQDPAKGKSLDAPISAESTSKTDATGGLNNQPEDARSKDQSTQTDQ